MCAFGLAIQVRPPLSTTHLRVRYAIKLIYILRQYHNVLNGSHLDLRGPSWHRTQLVGCTHDVIACICMKICAAGSYVSLMYDTQTLESE